MEDKSKEEKRAAGRLLLQKYQKKTKDGKSSPSTKNHPKDCNNSSDITKLNQELNAVFEISRNGHSEQVLTKTTEDKVDSSVPVNLFTFQKDSDSPAEQFFDSIRPSPQPSSSDHSEKFDISTNDSPIISCDVPLATNRFKEIEKCYDFSSSRSSKSDDETHKRSAEEQFNDDFVKEELERKLLESNSKVIHLETELRKAKMDLDHVRNQDIIQEESKEEKLHVHLKTIEILVGEKSELQQELSKLKDESLRNEIVNRELSAKLIECQGQLSSLKNEVSETYEAREQHNTILKKLEHSLAEANATAEMHRKEVIDTQKEMQVLNKKMEQALNNAEEMKKLIADKDKMLSLAEMRLAQLGSGQEIPTRDEVNELDTLKKECKRLNEEINKLMQEKSDIVCQYQQYIDTLNSQIQLLSQQYESCLVSKNQLITREESLVKHISELEKKVQKEHQAGPSLIETNLKLTQELKESETKIAELHASLQEKLEETFRLNAALEETSTKLNEAEFSLERLEVPDARKLQAAIESDRIAASRAIQQNTQLKEHVIELQEAIVRLNNEKLDLTEKWQHEEYVSSELNRELRKYKGKEEAEYRDAVAQCTVVFHEDQACQADIDEVDIPTSFEHVTPEAFSLLEKKLKKTMNDYANIYEEKQNLEHLVLHLQSETETIGEYVTLYQNQRSLLQERTKERDRQMFEVSKEREELRLKLAQISSLLPRVIQESGTTLPTQAPIPNGVDSNSDPATKIKTLLTEIESSNLMNNTDPGAPSNFHPCLLCSGKLITI